MKFVCLKRSFIGVESNARLLKWHFARVLETKTRFYDVVRYCQTLSDVVQMLSDVVQILSDVVRYCQMLSATLRYCQILSDIVRCCQILSDIVRCCPDVVRYCQILSENTNLKNVAEAISRPIRGDTLKKSDIPDVRSKLHNVETNRVGEIREQKS